MRPVLFACCGISVPSFAVALYLGVLVGVFAGVAPARDRGLAADDFILAATMIVAAGLLGARLWHVAEHRGLDRSFWRHTWRRSDGGAALYGGIFFGLGISPAILRSLGLPIAAFWDAGAIASMAGIALGRIGCLLHGCCAGRETNGPFGLLLPGRQGVWRPRFPTQLFEMLLCLLLFAGSEAALPRIERPGAVFLGVLAALGAGRFLLQGLREQVSNTTRLISALLTLVCSGGLLVLWA
jgi:phosphatidylglycerol---prolipoprotein diacylglyceryl transferase